VLIAEAQKQSEITRGEGDAEAVRIFAAAVGRDVKFFDFYRSLQAYRTALGDGATSFVLKPASPFFRYFGTMPSEPNPNLPGQPESGGSPLSKAPDPTPSQGQAAAVAP